ncbi:SUFB1 [Auxenochlorella protothecoides x Auxenochlorella symbiontica]
MHTQALQGASLLTSSLCPARPFRAGSRPARTSRPQCARVRATATDFVREPATEMSEEKRDLQRMLSKPYKYGFKTFIESDVFPKGLDEDVVRAISLKKEEPEWLLEFRLKAWRRWLAMEEPTWSDNDYPAIDYQAYSYYSAPRQKEKKGSLEEVDPELLATFDKLGIPLAEQKRLANVAVDAVFDSVSIATTFREELGKAGVIFCSISEAVREYPDLIRKHLGSVVPTSDNYFAALNSAVFSDGSFVYIPRGVRCPMELSTYFRINAAETGQFERTLIVAEEGSHVSYLEGGLGGRVLLRGPDQQPAAGRHGDKDDPRGAAHAIAHRVQGHLRRPVAQRLPRPGQHRPRGRRRAEPLPVRLHADRGRGRGQHLPVHPGAQPHRARGARGLHLQDRRGPAVLLPAAWRGGGGGGGHDHLGLLPRGV